MTSGEIYPNAPIALVAAEIRFPPVTDRPLAMPVHRQIREQLGTDWVIQNDMTHLFEAGLGPDGPKASVRSEPAIRIASRRRTRIITVGPEAVVLEVSDYRGFDDFKQLVGDVSAAVERILKPDGIARMGLRYVDEVTVPDPEPAWEQWVHASLQAPYAGDGLQASRWTGVVQYEIAPERILVFRYGPSAGPVVAANGPLRRDRVPSGELFMLDFDSSWQPTEIPEFRSTTVVETAALLREPIRTMFDALVTPSLLEVFRGAPR